MNEATFRRTQAGLFMPNFNKNNSDEQLESPKSSLISQWDNLPVNDDDDDDFREMSQLPVEPLPVPVDEPEAGLYKPPHQRHRNINNSPQIRKKVAQLQSEAQELQSKPVNWSDAVQKNTAHRGAGGSKIVDHWESPPVSRKKIDNNYFIDSNSCIAGH
jgi:hypothetical protein